MKFIEELGLALAAMKVFDLVDSNTDLKKEQLIQVQLQNENIRLKNQIARMEAERTIEVPRMPTEEEITAEVERICKLHGC